MAVYLNMIIAGILALGQILSPVGAWIMAGGEAAFFTEWSADDEFTSDSYIELKKTPGEDFVILNLADLQLYDDEYYDKEGEYTFQLVDKLIKEHDPDLITLSGDNAWGTLSYLETIKIVDSYGIPWAAVMGNHDGERCISEFWAAYHLSEAENCLFEFGPEDMGYGNYMINITENGKIIHSLYLMDTHDDRSYTLEDGTVVNDYDHLWKNQMAWYEWGVKGTQKLAGYPVQSTVIMHIPVTEYVEAWESVSIKDGTNIIGGEDLGVVNPLFSLIASGTRHEPGGQPPVTNGFFDLCKELGSTKNILVGHDHVNDYRVVYEGIGLNYAVKTGFGSYWEPEIIGGTTININSLGIATVNQHYYDLAENGWDIADD